MCQIQVSAQAAGIIPDRAGAGTVIILNINGRMACGTMHPCRQRHTGNLCSEQVTLQTDEAIAAAAFRRGSTGNTAVVIVTALRVDLRLPDVPAATDAAVISRFINALKARIDAYQKRKHREGKRVHPTTLHYVWAREFGECKGKKHYHLMLLVNRDTWCRAGDYRAPESLAGMIKQAWCSALGVDVGCHATLVHFPAWPAVWLARNDDTGFQQVLERADYLAKEHTKAHCTGERNFGCSRS